MRENKAFASLTSGLLARKGQARPAMRPQGFGQGVGPEDLGWNDMGYDVGRVAGPRLSASLSSGSSSFTPEPANSELPEVIRQQNDIAREFGEPVLVPAVEPVAAVAEVVVVAERAPEPLAPSASKAAPARRRAHASSKVASLAVSPRGDGRKAAFTLRLDAERHLRLRLACAVQNRSAQQFVTDALDQLLESLPDVSRLAASLPNPAGAENAVL